jgi:hypothetical protein
MALNCRGGGRQQRQLSGVKQPHLWLDRAAASDPQRTSPFGGRSLIAHCKVLHTCQWPSDLLKGAIA